MFFKDHDENVHQHEKQCDETSQIRKIFHRLDLNQNGKLEYKEFLAANLRKRLRDKLLIMSGLNPDEIKNQPEVQETMNQLLNAFQYFDISKSGFINKKDLIYVLSQQNLDP